MKFIIAGSRDATDYEHCLTGVWKARAFGFEPTMIVSGMARGADMLGVRYALEHDLPLIRMPANWKELGRSAGHMRNAEMARIGEVLVAIWDGVSPGTHNMIQTAKRRGLEVFIQPLR